MTYVYYSPISNEIVLLEQNEYGDTGLSFHRRLRIRNGNLFISRMKEKGYVVIGEL